MGDQELKQLGKDLKLGEATYFDGLSGPDISGEQDWNTIYNADNVRQALLIRLNCRKGDLWAHPEFGNPIWDMLSRPMDENFEEDATQAIRECLSAEPRAEEIRIDSELNYLYRQAAFSIWYRVLKDPKAHNLVWVAPLGGDDVV